MPKKEMSLGELYREISVSKPDFEEGAAETVLMKKKLHPYVELCKKLHSRYKNLGKGTKAKPEWKEAIDFLGWPLAEQEYISAVTAVLLISFIAAMILGAIVFFTPLRDMVAGLAQGSEILVPVYVFFPFIIVAFFITNKFQSYPMQAAKDEQVKALTYVPELIGYMIMSMKLVPNLEKAVEFAASHGRGRIAEDFKKLIWEVQIGTVNSLAEGLYSLAYRWGKFSDEFKHALMRIRASVIENTEAKRYALLDKTMSEILESVRLKMEQYARSLSQPSVMLFYMGVLLPLILIIVLPVGSAFSGTAMANPVVLILLYNIIIPVAAFSFAYKLVKSRPPTYQAPIIPDKFPGLPRKGTMLIGNRPVNITLVIVLVLIAGSMLAFFMSNQGFPPKLFMAEPNRAYQLLPFDQTEEEVLLRESKPANYFSEDGEKFNQLLAKAKEGKTREEVMAELQTEKQLYFMKSETDVTPYNLIFGFLITVGVAIYIYLHHTTIYKRKIQQDVMQMESEFKDSIYVLASRMGENKPVEDALKHTKEFLPTYKISQSLFGKTIDNISLLGMPLEAAVFDPEFGALKNNPSTIIRGSMKLLVDSVQLGVNVAARTMIALSIQLTNMEQVNKNLSTLVADTTSMMRTISTFIAPVVLGITTILQKIVIVTISGIASSSLVQQGADLGQLGSFGGGGFTNMKLEGLIKPSVIGSTATPTQFLLIVTFYIIELVVIMNYFTTKIEEDNDLMVRLNIAKAMPIAILVFVGSMIAANFLVGGYLS